MNGKWIATKRSARALRRAAEVDRPNRIRPGGTRGARESLSVRNLSVRNSMYVNTHRNVERAGRYGFITGYSVHESTVSVTVARGPQYTARVGHGLYAFRSAFTTPVKAETAFRFTGPNRKRHRRTRHRGTTTLNRAAPGPDLQRPECTVHCT